eukprot:CAMPEP_0113628362 /NCGR_PEP_ID=MMETSP0017_2-20120614/14695_1 /TAXON_ID=2856 /ORGANISM="Cylindrotheca closterium" /LENGTH=322 /DNA_ID=CAMNT_0000538663 /DNA_START=333 /DNA_END=1301 /DNA_ORIENTATION=+ /assembly_acc=CAM_ASM_000147
MANNSNQTAAVAHSKRSHPKRVRFDERCRVRPIKKLQSMDPEVREMLWYNREELKAIRKDCRNIVKEALHQLKRAQEKQKKKQAQERKRQLQAIGNNTPTPTAQQDKKQQQKEAAAAAAKHLFPPSAFRGLEMFHPKVSFKREGRRQDQWQMVLTAQAQQEMARNYQSSSGSSSSDDSSSDAPPQEQQQQQQQQSSHNKMLPTEEDLLKLAEISLDATQMAVKEAHKRALRDEKDLLHPPKRWMLPWLLPQVEENEEQQAESLPVAAITKKVKDTKLEKLLRKQEQQEAEDSSNPTTRRGRSRRTKSLSPVNTAPLHLRTMT